MKVRQIWWWPDRLGQFGSHVTLKEPLRRIGGVRWIAILLEHIVHLWIPGREPGRHMLTKRCLVTVGSNLLTVRHENDWTLFAITGHNPKDPSPVP